MPSSEFWMEHQVMDNITFFFFSVTDNITKDNWLSTRCPQLLPNLFLFDPLCNFHIQRQTQKLCKENKKPPHNSKSFKLTYSRDKSWERTEKKGDSSTLIRRIFQSFYVKMFATLRVWIITHSFHIPQSHWWTSQKRLFSLSL